MMLHQMARDFLIRSMYHATEPYFIAVAVENYGAACKALGHCLPLTEEQATWPRYERSEVEPSTPEHYGRMFAAIAEVFGPKEAAEQASALGLSWPKRIPPRAPDSRRER
jgi:hypothetical protein